MNPYSVKKSLQKKTRSLPLVPKLELGNEGKGQTLYSVLHPCDAFIMSVADLVTTDPDTLGGTAVFKGTRVPAKTLFEYLENNYSLDEFLECFPSVSREAASKLLDLSLSDR